MAILLNGKTIRRCSVCSITENVISFIKLKDTKTGNLYTHNKCVPCFKERRDFLRRIQYKNNREESIRLARKWNIDNRERYNKRRRLKKSLFNGCREEMV